MLARWLLWTLAALLCWGIWAILSKETSHNLSPAQCQALSTLGLMPVVVPLAFIRKPSDPGSRRWGVAYALCGGVLSSLGNVAYFQVLGRAPTASTVISLTALSPLVTVLLALPLLGERLNPIQLLGVVLSLFAIYLFNVRNEQGWFSAWLPAAFVAILLWGTAGFLQKLSTRHISGQASTIWFLLAFVPVAGFLLYREPLLIAVSPRDWWLTFAIGWTLAAGNCAILLAFASGGKASIISPLAGLYPLVSIPIAILWLGERIGGREWLGIVLALVAVVALACERTRSRPETSKMDPSS